MPLIMGLLLLLCSCYCVVAPAFHAPKILLQFCCSCFVSPALLAAVTVTSGVTVFVTQALLLQRCSFGSFALAENNSCLSHKQWLPR